MAYILSDNIVSPLGYTSAENYQAVKSGRSSLAAYPASLKAVGEDFCASLFSDGQNSELAVDGLSSFESIVFRSAEVAMQNCGLQTVCRENGGTTQMPCANVVFIMSTTKGNADLESPADSARRIARRLGINTRPIVVCNACISGLSAILLAKRLIDASVYDYAVVCGADRQGQFIISGFQSLKALSPKECRPFDMERQGLNLGEAAAAIVIGKESQNGAQWKIVSGTIRNDAFHVSAPSKKADGLYLSLKQTIGRRNTDKLAFVNAHGTATLFNDQMESVALDRMSLCGVPVNALKGYYGHTMGAAGLLETIISMHAVDDCTVLSTRGYEEKGVSGKLSIVTENKTTDKKDFVKMLSGFGGCNASVWLSKSNESCDKETIYSLRPTHRVLITPQSVDVDGKGIGIKEGSDDIITSLYKQFVGGYPKYYKMDKLCRLGFVATEMLLKAECDALGRENTITANKVGCEPDLNENRSIVLFNHSSSVDSDRRHMEAIADSDNYFPSPSVFVYTLPNIVTGEIAMKNGYHGETSFYLLDERDDKIINNVIGTAFSDGMTQSVIGGWMNYESENDFTADISIFVRK